MNLAKDIKTVLRLRSRGEDKTVVYMRNGVLSYVNAAQVPHRNAIRKLPWVGIYDADVTVEQIEADLKRVAA